jgi:hypothetical protein
MFRGSPGCFDGENAPFSESFNGCLALKGEVFASEVASFVFLKSSKERQGIESGNQNAQLAMNKRKSLLIPQSPLVLISSLW